ncbi:hypothetical protein [Candidatus Mesenet endosymbiont of Agriotes lineatus]|uniref:hypothetical protein n=1 Tax=Candidatus Mesenet endosymbiont of Agriotes lineatus TaxID=3077948 RepID=UPI0030CCB0AD
MQGTTPTPSPRSSLEEQLQVRQENVIVESEHQYAEIKKKPKDASGAKKHSLESSGSTDRENKSSSCSAEDEERKHESTKHKKKEHHSRSSSATDREHKSSSHSTRERRHKSKSHGEKHRSRPSSLKEQEIEPTYAEINDQPSISSPDEEIVFSHDILKANGTLGDEGLRQRNVNPLKKPLRAHSKTSDGTSTPSSKESSPPSYQSQEERRGSEDTIFDKPWPEVSSFFTKKPTWTIVNSWSKFKIKVAYPVQQRAFIIPCIAFITFVASYSILMPKYYASIQNLIKDPWIWIPIVVASILFAASMRAFISNLKDTRIKKTATQGDNEVFAKMKRINNEKCISSIELDLSNNTHYTLLDGRKYKTLAFKRLALTLNRPLICAEMAAFVTLTSTYLLTKYFEIGFKNLADSLSTFNTNNVELIGFTAAASVLLALFTCSFIHYYRKECVEGLELKKCPREIESFNKEYIREAKDCYDSKKTLSSGKHSEGKAASLTISQAIVEYYNSKAVIVAS